MWAQERLLGGVRKLPHSSGLDVECNSRALTTTCSLTGHRQLLVPLNLNFLPLPLSWRRQVPLSLPVQGCHGKAEMREALDGLQRTSEGHAFQLGDTPASTSRADLCLTLTDQTVMGPVHGGEG